MMNKPLPLSPSLFAALALCSGLLLASASAQAQVSVSQPWVRATVAQQSATGAFMELKAETASRLVEVRSPVAGVVEIHEMSMDGSVMRMRAVPGLDLPAGQSVALKPGGYHVMLMALKAPVAAGSEVPLTLVFEGADKQRQTLEIKAPAKAMGGSSPKPMSHHGMKH